MEQSEERIYQKYISSSLSVGHMSQHGYEYQRNKHEKDSDSLPNKINRENQRTDKKNSNHWIDEKNRLVIVQGFWRDDDHQQFFRLFRTSGEKNNSMLERISYNLLLSNRAERWWRKFFFFFSSSSLSPLHDICCIVMELFFSFPIRPRIQRHISRSIIVS